jgi:hypothetical protein
VVERKIAVVQHLQAACSTHARSSSFLVVWKSPKRCFTLLGVFFVTVENKLKGVDLGVLLFLYEIFLSGFG